MAWKHEHTTIITNPQSNAKTTLQDYERLFRKAKATAGIQDPDDAALLIHTLRNSNCRPLL